MYNRVLLSVALWLLASTALAEQRFVGVTSAVHDLELSVQVDGVVSAIKVKEGQRVKKGDVILSLDYRLQELEEKRRQLALQDRERFKVIEQNIEIVWPMLNSSRKLYESSASVSQDEVRKLEMQYAGLLGERNVLEEQKKRETVEYEMAKADRQRRTLIAPMDGVITDVRVEAGEWARPGEPVVRLVTPEECYLLVNIEEAVARELKSGSEVALRINAGSEEIEKAGKVQLVSSVADQASGLVRVRVRFDNRDNKVWPGMPGSLIVPGSADTAQQEVAPDTLPKADASNKAEVPPKADDPLDRSALDPVNLQGNLTLRNNASFMVR